MKSIIGVTFITEWDKEGILFSAAIRSVFSRDVNINNKGRLLVYYSQSVSIITVAKTSFRKAQGFFFVPVLIWTFIFQMYCIYCIFKKASTMK